jgi:pimeloyl-ACP methyl ester carboxylesterase
VTETETRVIELRDGRDLAWVEFGAPDGVPVFAFHGSPGSRTMYEIVGAVAGARHVRLIAPDRPGYGHSTFDPGRTFASWAADVAALADHLGVEDFGVVGVSDGGPNTAACAHYLGDRLTACAIVSSPAPPDAHVAEDGMLPMNRIAYRLARFAPAVLARVTAAGIRQGRRSPERALAFMTRALPPADASVLARSDIHDWMLHELRRPASATAGRAATQDLVLDSRPWGFRLEDIEARVHVWHGEADRNVMFASGVHIAQAIPGAAAHFLPDLGHWMWIDRFDEILAGVVT